MLSSANRGSTILPCITCFTQVGPFPPTITLLGGARRYKSAVTTATENSVIESSSLSSTSEARGTQFKEGPSSESGCPFTGRKSELPPKLKHVPKLPFLGSLISSYSGIPPFEPGKMYEFEIAVRRKFGDFYTLGFPIFGRGLFAETINITSPEEMLKVIRAEGAYPSGLVNNAWAFANAFLDDGSPLVGPRASKGDQRDLGILGVGKLWKQQRTFLQMGMLDPKSARGFVPGIVQAAKLASKGAPAAGRQGNVNHYLNLCAFDMFSSFMLGELTQCAPTAYHDRHDNTHINQTSQQRERQEENMAFCRSAINGMELSAQMGFEPLQGFAQKIGYKTKKYRAFYEEWSTARRISMKKLHSFIERYHEGNLTEMERNSYMFNALERYERGENGPEDPITKEVLMDLCIFALFVGVDTTSSVTAWNLVHIAMNFRVQEKLYHELSAAVQETGGELTAKSLEKKAVPYLHACIRENYRLTPPFTAATFKRATQGEIELHGHKFPSMSMVMLKNKYNDPDVLDDAFEFRPERWLSDAVEARKGTPFEEMDHALFRDVFGQGARRCPGSRVATNEVLCLIAQLVMDYKIRPSSPDVRSLDDIKYGLTALICPHVPPLDFVPRELESQTEQVAA
jgi:cytochrome P450